MASSTTTPATHAGGDPELFKLNGKPGWLVALPQALQHVLAMLVGNIAPPLLIGAALKLPTEDITMLVQGAMIIAAITTLVQLYPVWKFGMGLPNVMGVAFAYMPVLMAIGLQYGRASGAAGVRAILGAQVIGGFTSVVIGFVIGHIRKFFPPIVSGTVVLAIGLSLYGTALTYMAGGAGSKFIKHPNHAPWFGRWEYWVIASVTLAITLFFNLKFKGYLRITGMLFGIVAGYLLTLVWLGTGPQGVNFAGVKTAKLVWIPKWWGLDFHANAIFMMIMMYIVQAVQTIGDVSSTAIGGFRRQATDKELGGAITGQGICGMLGAFLGGLPTDPYSQNVGLIVTTKVVAKRVFLIVAIIVGVAGLFPIFGAVMTTIPQSVLGGATVAVFAAITMSGIELITQQPLTYRNKMIVGISLAMGVGFWFLASSADSNALLKSAIHPQLLNIIGTGPIVLAFVMAFTLNLLFPGGPEDAELPEDLEEELLMADTPEASVLSD